MESKATSDLECSLSSYPALAKLETLRVESNLASFNSIIGIVFGLMIESIESFVLLLEVNKVNETVSLFLVRTSVPFGVVSKSLLLEYLKPGVMV